MFERDWVVTELSRVVSSRDHGSIRLTKLMLSKISVWMNWRPEISVRSKPLLVKSREFNAKELSEIVDFLRILIKIPKSTFFTSKWRKIKSRLYEILLFRVNVTGVNAKVYGTLAAFFFCVWVTQGRMMHMLRRDDIQIKRRSRLGCFEISHSRTESHTEKYIGFGNGISTTLHYCQNQMLSNLSSIVRDQLNIFFG